MDSKERIKFHKDNLIDCVVEIIGISRDEGVSREFIYELLNRLREMTGTIEMIEYSL